MCDVYYYLKYMLFLVPFLGIYYRILEVAATWWGPWNYKCEKTMKCDVLIYGTRKDGRKGWDSGVDFNQMAELAFMKILKKKKEKKKEMKNFQEGTEIQFESAKFFIFTKKKSHMAEILKEKKNLKHPEGQFIFLRHRDEHIYLTILWPHL